MACGLSIKAELVDDFRKKLNEKSNLQKEDFEKVINIDARIPIDKLSLEFAQSLDKLEPYGKDNPKAKFADKKIKIKNINLIGKNKNTLKMTLNKNNRDIDAIKFNAVSDYNYLKEKFNNASNKIIDAIYYPDINDFRGKRSLQVKLIDIR